MKKDESALQTRRLLNFIHLPTCSVYAIVNRKGIFIVQESDGKVNFAIHKFKELIVDRATSPITGSEEYQWDLLFISRFEYYSQNHLGAMNILAKKTPVR